MKFLAPKHMCRRNGPLFLKFMCGILTIYLTSQVASGVMGLVDDSLLFYHKNVLVQLTLQVFKNSSIAVCLADQYGVLDKTWVILATFGSFVGIVGTFIGGSYFVFRSPDPITMLLNLVIFGFVATLPNALMVGRGFREIERAYKNSEFYNDFDEIQPKNFNASQDLMCTLYDDEAQVVLYGVMLLLGFGVTVTSCVCY